MGGRGKASAGGARALIGAPNGVNRLSQEDLARRLGFSSVEEMNKARELHDFLGSNPNGDAQKVVEHLAKNGGRGLGSIGPIMLRIGLPRNKLLDIVHALKPLRDHGILSAAMPLSYKSWEDPFELAVSSSAHEPGAQRALARTEITMADANIWLKKIKNAPIDLIRLIRNTSNQ